MAGFEPDFVHLRVRSSYSLLEGAITPGALVDLCHKYKTPAVAISDKGNLFGSLEFSQACSNNGIQPIIGCIVDVNISEDKQLVNNSFDSMLLIAKNQEGYQNLLHLISKSFLKSAGGVKPHIRLEDLKNYSGGIIALTGGMDGPINRCLLAKQDSLAEKILWQLYDIYGDCLYVELIRCGEPHEDDVEDALIELAYRHNIPLVATNDVYFADRSIHKAHDALLCIADGRYITESDRRKITEEHYFKSQREMVALFKDVPEAVSNTVLIAKRCSVMSEGRPPMLPHFACGDGRNEADELREMSERGLRLRLEQSVFKDHNTENEKQALEKDYFDRLHYELDVIINMDFPGYFLIVSDFIKWSKRNGIPVGPGRGSGAGSVVAWSLEITDLDPLRFGLLFERFLNPERISMPDFDVDFCQERREEVILYVQEKYGRDRVAQIITFGKLQARAVIRDVGRVLQMPYGQVDRISKMIPFNALEPVTLSKAISMDRTFKNMINDDHEISELVNICLKLEGLNRHASTHAAGVVIADRSLDELVPVYLDPRSDMPVCGYSMKYAEGSGLVKFDFLGLKTLTVIAKTCELVRKSGIEIDIGSISIDDARTFKMLSEGDSVGVFQLESAGMRDTLRKLKPDNIDDVIALISLYRPGPMDNIPSYIARKHGTEEPDYLDPMLEEVLKETYGVIIYQEQVMQIAQIMGGYSLGAADLLRRAMGKKIASEMDAQRKIFVEGAVQNNVNKAKASGIFDLVAKFAGYGFNKSHAAAYAMISYQTAYLKAHHLVEFLCASMNLEINDTDKINTFCQEAKEHGVVVLPPDFNLSSTYFTPQEHEGKLAVRYGLGALKNVGVAAMESLEKTRNNHGRFEDIFDMVAHVEESVLNKRQMESLVKSGAFDDVHDNRCELFESIELISRYGSLVHQEKNSNQSSLFGNDVKDITKPQLVSVDDWPNTERMNKEFEAVGLYLNKHPIEAYVNVLKKMKVKLFSDMVSSIADGSSNVRVAGVLISKKMRSSARGRFANILLSDPTGIFEVSVYNEDVLASSQDILESGNVLLMDTEIRKDDGGVRITANSISSLEDAVAGYCIKIYVDNMVAMADVKNRIGSPVAGKTKISIIASTQSHKVEITLPESYNLSVSALEDLKSVSGVSYVEEA